MVQSWRNSATRKPWEGHPSNQFRGLDVAAAVDLLAALNVAKGLHDLSPIAERRLAQVEGRAEKAVGYDGQRWLAYLL